MRLGMCSGRAAAGPGLVSQFSALWFRVKLNHEAVVVLVGPVILLRAIAKTLSFTGPDAARLVRLLTYSLQSAKVLSSIPQSKSVYSGEV